MKINIKRTVKIVGDKNHLKKLQSGMNGTKRNNNKIMLVGFILIMTALIVIIVLELGHAC